MRTKIVLVVCLISAVSLQAADVYKIIDENGRVKFTQFPPYKDAEKLKLDNSDKNQVRNDNNNSSKSSRERQDKYSDYLQSERLERKDKRIQAKKEKAERVSKCHVIRAELEDMNQGGTLYYDLDEDGERVYIDESRVEEKKKRLSDYLDKRC